MKNRSYLFLVIFASIIILADRLTKIFAQNIEINKGAAFGIFPNRVLLLIIIAFLIIILIFYFYKKVNTIMQIALILILAGTISNTIDRIFLGYVIDFIKISFIPNSSAFNLADLSNIAGAIILLFTLIKKKK